MHRPQSHAESRLSVRLWLRAHGRQTLVLAVLYFLFGRASFLVQVDDVLVTPVLFAPEGIALAMALRFGAAVWPGVFAGQLVLALSLGLAPWPAVSISAINSLEAVLAVFLFRAFKLDATLPRARDLAGLLLLVFFILQPFSATLGNATLWAGDIVDRAGLPASWLNWWIGNSFGQMLVAPLLLALFAGGRTKRQTAGDFLVPLLVTVPAFWAADYLLRWTGVSSLVAVFAPILVLLAIYRGLAAVCMGGLLVAVGALYATSHAFGPFVSQGRADIPGLNLFIIGLALSGQFLAVFLRQLRTQQKLADQLRDARERLQRTAYELTENIPVGTYVLEFDAEGNPGFTFVSERWLKMLDLSREDVLADHTLAMSAVHPDERDDFNRLNAEVFAEKKRFFWEGRIVVHAATRWVTIESIPRNRPGGGTVWEGVMTDITDRKAAEARLQRVLDNLPIAVASTTLTSPADMTFINEEFTRTFGYTAEDVPNVAAWAEKAYPDPDYRREVFREWDQAVIHAIETKGTVESMEFEVTCKDGTKRDIIFRAVVLDDSLLVSMTDVTEHKKAQAALRSLREELERTAFELTENIPVGTYTMVQPPDGGMAYFSFLSTRFLELTGLEGDAARADPMNAFACVHPDDYAEWVRKNTYVFEHKLPFKEECRVVVGGQTRWITAESTPRDMPDGSIVWEGVLTDITDRKLAEQKVAANEARLRKILDNIPIPVAINDARKDGRITFLNEAFTRVFGYTLEDVPDVGAWARLAYPDKDYRATTFRTWDTAVTEAARTDGAVAPMEFRVSAKDGRRLDVIINAVALEDMLLVGFVDITARKRAEEQVTAANRNMQLAASAARLGFWELDVATGLDRWDEEMARINGIALPDFDGHWEKFVHPDDHDEVMLETRRMLESDTIFAMEYRIRRPDGEVRHVRERGIVTRDDKGRAQRVNGVLQDITDEKDAAVQLKQSAQRMQLAATAAGIGFWSRDVDKGLEEWDDQMLRIYGVTREHFDGRWEPFVHPEDLPQVEKQTEIAMRQGTPGRYEYRIIRPDGTMRHIRGLSTTLRTSQGAPVREIGVNFDITDELEAAEQLKQSAQRTQLAAAAVGIGFWSRDLASGLQEWDDQMLSIYGIRREDFDGRWEPFVHPDDLAGVQEPPVQDLPPDTAGRYEYRIVRPDGTVRHVRGMSVAVRDARGEAVREIGVNFDITDEKESAAREKQLEEQHRRDLETKLKTSLSAAAVAHEINQPLSSILLQSKMALEQGEAESDSLQIIAHEAQRVVKTIDKMKTLLRNVQTDQRVIDLAEVAQSALLYNKGLLAKHRIKLHTASLDQPCRIKGDDAQLQLAITNLLRNAAEAIAEAKRRKRSIALDLIAKDDAVELVIGDSGPSWPAGAPAEVPLTTTKKAGTGIGLYVVRTAMENHRGEIVFGQSPLGGAEVRLRFPRVQEKS